MEKSDFWQRKVTRSRMKIVHSAQATRYYHKRDKLLPSVERQHLHGAPMSQVPCAKLLPLYLRYISRTPDIPFKCIRKPISASSPGVPPAASNLGILLTDTVCARLHSTALSPERPSKISSTSFISTLPSRCSSSSLSSGFCSLIRFFFRLNANNVGDHCFTCDE